jgi:hypothetical protein
VRRGESIRAYDSPKHRYPWDVAGLTECDGFAVSEEPGMDDITKRAMNLANDCGFKVNSVRTEANADNTDKRPWKTRKA